MTDTEISEFLRDQVVARIGCHVDGQTYVVPIIYAWDAGCAYVYSIEGQKISMMRQNPNVCFEVDEYLAGGGWRSVIIQGTYEELDTQGSARALALLADRFARRRTDASSNGSGGTTQRPRGGGRVPVAFRVRANEITGRRVERSVQASAQRRIGKFLARRNAARSN
jgi:nitroimidazol reductase NimA-like FMN-containing flavoprotein (pyridoxamine 5'-phosphate oxidase superfamily)